MGLPSALGCCRFSFWFWYPFECPTELVVYPGEYHEFKTPSHLKDRLERYLSWYNHYVNGDPAPARPPEALADSKAAVGE